MLWQELILKTDYLLDVALSIRNIHEALAPSRHVAKDICKRIHNKYLNPLLIEKAMRALVDLDAYSNWVSFKSPGADALVISLSREEKLITISISESQDMDFEIRGEPNVVTLFIKEMTAEVASIAATELCTCLVTEEEKASLRAKFRRNLLDAINSSFREVE